MLSLKASKCQSAVEQEFDLDLTLASYNDTEIPYIFTGQGCNVNYAEIMYLISMSPEYRVIYTQFDYTTFCNLLNEDDFLRCLYDLDVTKAEKRFMSGNRQMPIMRQSSMGKYISITIR